MSATDTPVPGIDIGPVTAWLEANVAGARGPFEFEVIAGGHSNLTFKVTGAASAPESVSAMTYPQ